MYSRIEYAIIRSNEKNGWLYSLEDHIIEQLELTYKEIVRNKGKTEILLDCTGNRHLVPPTANDNKVKIRCYGCIHLFNILCNHRYK